LVEKDETFFKILTLQIATFDFFLSFNFTFCFLKPDFFLIFLIMSTKVSELSEIAVPAQLEIGDLP